MPERRTKVADEDDELLDPLSRALAVHNAKSSLSQVRHEALDGEGLLGPDSLGLVIQAPVFTVEALREWHRQNGTEYIEIDQTAIDRTKRYKMLFELVSDRFAAFLPQIADVVIGQALAGKSWAIKYMFEYTMGAPTQRQDINVNSNSVNLTVEQKNDNAVEALRRLQEMVKNAYGAGAGVIVDGNIVERDDVEALNPPAP